MKILFTVVALLLSPFLFGQYTQNIRGVVSDEASGAPLPAVNVALVGSDENYGASTNDNGAYDINDVPVGRYNLVVRYVGYEPFLARNIELNSGKERVINIELTEQVVTVGEVTVRAFSNGEV
nr:carboxypeptidase-like regulatory domain-containing protein [Prolixibacteraceae bacterium]